jgi:hypothetical protein
MKSVNIPLTDEEFGALLRKKNESGIRTWHDYLLWSAGLLKKRDIRK